MIALKKQLQCGYLHYGTLYFALAGIWGLPFREEIVGTITAVDTFLGVILGISSANYKKMNESNEITTFEEGVDEDEH